MRLAIAALIVGVAATAALADDVAINPAGGPASVDATIARGLTFLEKDALAWKSERKCVSCHHASLVVWAMREAQLRELPVSEPFLSDLSQWIAETGGDGKTGITRPEGIPKALNEKAVSLALAMEADRAPNPAVDASYKRLLQTVKDDQMENGAWASWPETRQPIFGNSDERTTAAAVLALWAAAAAGDEAAKSASQKGIKWLTETPSDADPQSQALRVIVWKRYCLPMEQVAPIVDQIRHRQNPDGGWSQTPDMASDAWATGQALYALTDAGAATNDASIRRGQDFLIQSQRADGSWPMISRPIKPAGEGSKSLVPITAAGSAWAVMGLARSR